MEPSPRQIFQGIVQERPRFGYLKFLGVPQIVVSHFGSQSTPQKSALAKWLTLFSYATGSGTGVLIAAYQQGRLAPKQTVPQYICDSTAATDRLAIPVEPSEDTYDTLLPF